MTRAVGSRNQMMPSNSKLTKKEEGMKMTCGVWKGVRKRKRWRMGT
jgi:hypothetical protein